MRKTRFDRQPGGVVVALASDMLVWPDVDFGIHGRRISPMPQFSIERTDDETLYARWQEHIERIKTETVYLFTTRMSTAEAAIQYHWREAFEHVWANPEYYEASRKSEEDDRRATSKKTLDNMIKPQT